MPVLSLHVNVDETFSKNENMKLEVKLTTPSKTETILDHPDCLVSECADCHVVSCPIYLAYETLGLNRQVEIFL